MNNSQWDNIESEFLYYASLTNTKSQIMEAFNALRAGKQALDGIKILKQYADEIEDVHKRGEFMYIIGTLREELADIKIENSEYKLKIQELEKEIEKLKSPKFNVIWKDNFYYKENEKEKYCSGCYDSKRELIKVTLKQHKTYGADHFCPVCKVEYKEYKS